MESQVSRIFQESSQLKRRMAEDAELAAGVAQAARVLLGTIEQGGTIYTCGNGGSACDAMHFSEELVARYKRKRPGIRSRHLLDAGIITCWANDESFETVFSRQVETLCGPADALVIFSTSGNSENAVQAATAAARVGARTIGLVGKGGGRLAGLCDLALVVPSDATERIQEAHITIVHTLCELIETQS